MKTVKHSLITPLKRKLPLTSLFAGTDSKSSGLKDQSLTHNNMNNQELTDIARDAAYHQLRLGQRNPARSTYPRTDEAYRASQSDDSDRVDSLFKLCEQLESENKILKKRSVHIYNSGYKAGHHDSVEGGYVCIYYSDMDSYHEEEVEELIEELIKSE